MTPVSRQKLSIWVWRSRSMSPVLKPRSQHLGLPLENRSSPVLSNSLESVQTYGQIGVTLWEMVTGKTPFQGTPGEVMHQHLHAPLPLDELEGVPQPLVVPLEALLEKDPAKRFQNPGELLKAIPTISGQIEAGRRITREGLHKMPHPRSRTETRKPPARQRPKKISVAKLPVTGSDLFGREDDVAFLDDAWATPGVNVVTIVAWAGVGKSTLINHWLRRLAAEQYRSAQLVFGWSFYRQGTSGGTSSADEFVDAALAWFGDPDPRIGTAWEKVKDWPSSSRIVGPCWFWTVWSRCKIRLVQEREGYGTLLSRLFSASLQLSIPGFA